MCIIVAVELSKFNSDELSALYSGTYCRFDYKEEAIKPKIWIESELDIEDSEEYEHIATYYLPFSPSGELTKLGEKLEEAMVNISGCDGDARSRLCGVNGVMCFSVKFNEFDEPIVIDTDGKDIQFESLLNKKFFGRCKISIGGFTKLPNYFDDGLDLLISDVRVEQIILK